MLISFIIPCNFYKFWIIYNTWLSIRHKANFLKQKNNINFWKHVFFIFWKLQCKNSISFRCFHYIYIILKNQFNLISKSRKPIFSSCNSDFIRNNDWVELSHMHIQYIDIKSESRKDIKSLCSPLPKWYYNKQK